MPLVVTSLPISGSIGQITFYMLGGKNYARRKSCLDKKRIMTDPSFSRFMKSARELAEASRIASAVYLKYRQIMGKNDVDFYRRLTGVAKIWLCQGIDKEVVRQWLIKDHLLPMTNGLTMPAAQPSPRSAEIDSWANWLGNNQQEERVY